jgi:hypothetical protein
MKHGVVGGIAVCLLLVASWSSCVVGVSVYVNDALLTLTHPILAEGGSVLVPIEEFGRSVGIETTVDGNRLVLRWRGGRRSLDADRYAARDGIPYATLEWTVGLIGGEIHRVGETWYVETPTAALEDVEATAERVVLRFEGFVPITMSESDDGTELLLTIHHCRLDIQPQWIVLGAEGIQSVRIPSGTPSRVDVWITLQEGATVRSQTYESSGFYSFCLETAAHPQEETVVQIGDGLTLHELATVVSTEGVSANWLYVEAWRDRYRLTPAFPSAGFETLASVEELAGSSNAVAAVNLGCSRTPSPIHLLVIDGIPYTVDAGTCDGLGIDLFGWWSYFSADALIYAKHGGERIPVDEVNRPLRYGEVIAYPPGYVGIVARGVAGSFSAVKVRSGRVVSVYEGPFVAADPTAMLLVASGDAKARLSLIRLGDPLSLECGVGREGTSFAHAFSAGPILIDSGVPAVTPEPFSSDPPDGWLVLATDWHGGLILLSFVRETGSEEEIRGDLISFLSSMPVPIRDAIVLSRCGENVLVVRGPSSVCRLGSGDPYALALCLVPLSP